LQWNVNDCALGANNMELGCHILLMIDQRLSLLDMRYEKQSLVVVGPIGYRRQFQQVPYGIGAVDKKMLTNDRQDLDIRQVDDVSQFHKIQ
jgi:hypothetical protein